MEKLPSGFIPGTFQQFQDEERVKQFAHFGLRLGPRWFLFSSMDGGKMLGKCKFICICNLFYFSFVDFGAVFLDEACLRFHFTKKIMLDALMLKLGRMESRTNFRELCSSPWQALLGQRPKWSSDALSFPGVAMTCHTWLCIDIALMENWFRGRQWPRKRWLSSRNNWENLWLSSCGTLTKRSSTHGWFDKRLTEEKTQTRKHKPTSHHLIDFISAIFEPDASKVYPNPTVCDLDLFWSEIDEWVDAPSDTVFQEQHRRRPCLQHQSLLLQDFASAHDVLLVVGS